MSDEFEPVEVKTFGDAYPGRFLRADSSAFANGQVQTYTIERVLLDQLEGSKGKELKLIIVLRETPQAWVAPKICGQGLKHMFGGDVTRWHGKRVALFATDKQMPMPPKKEPCLRVWGSPDIDSDIAFEFTPPRRKPIPITLHATGKPTRWTDRERAAFCAELGRRDLQYEDVAQWCEALGRPRPSAMAPDRRASLLQALDGEARGRFDAWMAERASLEPPADTEVIDQPFPDGPSE